MFLASLTKNAFVLFYIPIHADPQPPPRRAVAHRPARAWKAGCERHDRAATGKSVQTGHRQSLQDYNERTASRWDGMSCLLWWYTWTFPASAEFGLKTTSICARFRLHATRQKHMAPRYIQDLDTPIDGYVCVRQWLPSVLDIYSSAASWHWNTEYQGTRRGPGSYKRN